MITPEYCKFMARYNAWQNGQLGKALESLPEEALHMDRGAFFSSLMGTANHLLWGDTLWISRFDGLAGPASIEIAQSTGLMPSLADWTMERFRIDGRISKWARAVRQLDLTGDLTYYSGSAEREMTLSKQTCVLQMFNHQTHHRGQLHAMLGAAGAPMPVTDIPMLPE